MYRLLRGAGVETRSGDEGGFHVSFLVQILKLVIFVAVAVAAYAAYKPEAIAPFFPRAAPYAQMAHAYLPAAITGEKPAAAPAPAAPPRPPVSVQVAKAERKTVPWTITDIGTAQAVASVALKSHFDATVLKVSVADGAEVKLSVDILNRIDEIVPPGTNFSAGDAGYVPPALADPFKRRRRTA